jgi:hypothetical protein
VLRESATISIFDGVMDAVMVALVPTHSVTRVSRACDRAHKMIGSLCVALPFGSTKQVIALSQKNSLSQTCSLFKDLGKAIPNRCYPIGSSSHCGNCSLISSSLDLNKTIQEAVKKSWEAMPGLCLACYKAHGKFVHADCKHSEGGQSGDD